MLAYHAHSGLDRVLFRDFQLLRDHLRQVAKSAQTLADVARPGDHQMTTAAHVAGLLHDLGKYRPEFQDYLHGLPVNRERKKHKQAGAAWGQKHAAVAVAILGHHGGMPDLGDVRKAVSSVHGEPVVRQVWPNACVDCPDLANLQLPTFPSLDKLTADLFTRLLFSVLVDADWADTSAHSRSVKGQPAEPEPARFEPEVWLEHLYTCIREKAGGCKDAKVAAVARRRRGKGVFPGRGPGSGLKLA